MLGLLADHVKVDPSFKPVRAHSTLRVHVSAAGYEWELLVDGPKFFDARARTGGGGPSTSSCTCGACRSRRPSQCLGKQAHEAYLLDAAQPSQDLLHWVRELGKLSNPAAWEACAPRMRACTGLRNADDLKLDQAHTTTGNSAMAVYSDSRANDLELESGVPRPGQSTRLVTGRAASAS